MCHQVNFYITPDDARMIEAALKAEHPLVIVEDISKSKAPSVVDTAVMEDDKGPRLFFHMVRWPDLRGVVMKRVEARGEWAVDVLQSRSNTAGRTLAEASCDGAASTTSIDIMIKMVR